MPAQDRNQFATAFLQGLYGSGVGNPEVQDKQNEYKLALAKEGVLPQDNQGGVPSNHPVWQKVGSAFKNILYPSSTPDLSRAYQNAPANYFNPTTGKMEILPGGQPAPSGSMRIPRSEVPMISLMARMNKPPSTNVLSPEETDNLAQMLVEGRMKPFDLGWSQSRGKVVARAAEMAKEKGIPFTTYAGAVRETGQKYFTSGKGGQIATSLNTALQHLDDASQSFNNLNNIDVRLLNVPINKLKEQTNDPTIIALEGNVVALKGELANVFKQSGATDQEISSWDKVLTPDLTPTQFSGLADKIDSLLRARLKALEYQRQGISSPDQPLLSPSAASLLGQQGKRGGSGSQGGGVPDGTVKSLGGKSYIKRNGQWEQQ